MSTILCSNEGCVLNDKQGVCVSDEIEIVIDGGDPICQTEDPE